MIPYARAQSSGPRARACAHAARGHQIVIRCPRLRQIPYPLAGHQDLPQYYVEVETIFCGLQMSQMSCIERTLLPTMLKMLKKVEIERTLLQTMLKMLKKVNTNNVEKSHPKPQTSHSPGSLLVKRQNESPGRTVARTNPGFRVWGSSWRKEYLPPIFALLKIPQSGPILRTKYLQKKIVAVFQPGNTRRLQEPVLSLAPPTD